MYETFYGLSRRPFAAAPDPANFVPVPAAVAAFEQIERCVRDGAGVAVLTAVAGAGKTQLCLRLERALGDAFAVAYLPNAGFPSRRGLLQAALYELGRPQLRLGEAELRRELVAVAREQGRPLALILDEAHRYPERLLDELRAIANLVDGGEPVARIVLAGQLELEEQLADPELAGLNERIGVQASLPRLTAAESYAYLRARTAATGGNVESLFSEDALELLVRACGGLPRCLNQLADHSLLLGFVAERRPIDVGLVTEALDDLRRLPLQWSAAPAERSMTTFETAPEGAVADEPLGGEASCVFEFGAEPDEPDEFDADEDSVEFGALEAGELEAVEEPAEPIRPSRERKRLSMVRPVEVRNAAAAEEPVADRYARLDAAARTRRWLDEQDGPPAAERRAAVDPLSILDRIEPLVAEELAEGNSELPATAEQDRAIVSAKFATLFRDLRRQQAETR